MRIGRGESRKHIGLPFCNGEGGGRGMESKHLCAIPTSELVEELKNREGVKIEQAEPYEDKRIIISGPALILIVID